MITRRQLARANSPTDSETAALTMAFPTPQNLPVIERCSLLHTYVSSVKEGGLRTGDN